MNSNESRRATPAGTILPSAPAPAPDAGRRRVLAAAAPVGASLLPRFAIGQGAWPNKPVRILVTNPPGGLTDSYARHYAEVLSKKFGQPFVVDNKGGAGGMIASDALAKSAPDGYTMMVAIQTPLWQGRVLYRTMPYNPDTAFAPVSLLPSGALVMGVHANLPIRNPSEFVAYAAKNPAAIGTYAAGSWPHMIADTWNRTRGLKIEAIHYKGEPPMWIDVSTGLVAAGVGTFPPMNMYVERGQIRPIGVLGQRRSPRAPNVPTFVEQGHTDPVFALDGWLPVVVPAGTPQDIQQKLADAIVEAYQAPKVQQMHQTFGIPNGPVGLEEARRRWKDESPQWITLADRLGIKLD
ncbi:MAG: tripartite tricarboxylate transporter substrate binding protein [Burkholderiaceae bacterium]